MSDEVIVMKKTNRLIFVLLGIATLVSTVLVLSIIEGTKERDYTDDESYMDIYANPYDVKLSPSVDEVCINDAILNKPLEFDNGRVTHITFENCTLSTSRLGDFDKVDAITMIECELLDLTWLSENTKIKFLDIDSCYMSSLNGVQYLKELESLYIYDVGIESIELLKSNKQLKEVGLINTCVTDLSPIENMDIEYLDISNTLSIRDLSPVMTLDELDDFYSDNCEMAYTTELCKFIKKNHIENDMLDDWREIQESVREISEKLFTPSMSNEEKIEATVEYVIDIMDYDFSVEYDDDVSTKYDENVLSYAIKGEGDCRNYSALTMVLLQEAGITVYEIKGPNHIWNIIDLGDDYYWLDVTWLDGDEDFTQSPYYMSNEYYFFDHEDAFTMPSSMYKPDYLLK